MKVLNLSLDKSILEAGSRVGERIKEYGTLTEKYWVIVPARHQTIMELSDRVRVFGVAGRCKTYNLFKIYFLGRRILEQEKFDVITAQDPYYLALIGLILSKKFKTGFEIQIHGWEKFYGWRRLIAKFVVARAGAVKVVSQRLKKQLVDEFGIKELKITVVPIYTEITNSPAFAKAMAGEQKPIIKNTSDRFLFLTVGRLVPIKNVDMQIEAMAEIIKDFPSSELWIVGGGPERKKLKFKIENLKLADNIKLLGWQNNLAYYYSQTDAFLLTSNYEGWGLSVIEAASYGLPIVMTDVGCAGEVITNEESGIIIPVGEKEKLKLAMKRLIQDNELRKKLSAAAMEAIKNLPDKEQTFKLYKKSWQIAADNKL